MDMFKLCEMILRRLKEIVPLLPVPSRAVVVLAVTSVPVIYLFEKDIPAEMRFWLVVMEVLFLFAVAILCYRMHVEASGKLAMQREMQKEIDRLNAAVAAGAASAVELRSKMATAKTEILEGELELMKILGLVPEMLRHVHGIHRMLLSVFMRLS